MSYPDVTGVQGSESRPDHAAIEQRPGPCGTGRPASTDTGRSRAGAMSLRVTAVVCVGGNRMENDYERAAHP